MDFKICGIKTKDALDAAVASGARYVGFVFVEGSPRFIAAEQAKELSLLVPTGVKSVGLFSNPDEALLARVLPYVMLDMIQLHGDETPEDVARIRVQYGLPVMKAVNIGSEKDLEQVKNYENVADMILLDAKPVQKKSAVDASAEASMLKGGHGQAFDWSVLAEFSCSVPWMLAGGLKAEFLSDAFSACPEACLPVAFDVSSGVEIEKGVKDPEMIKEFAKNAREIS